MSLVERGLPVDPCLFPSQVVLQGTMDINNKFYVYVHKDLHGNIKYVGSGTGQRYRSKVGRSKLHLQQWDLLTKEIFIDGLSLEDSTKKEQELLDTVFGSTFNKIKKVASKKRKFLEYKYFRDFFYIDLSNNDCLRWKVDRTNGRNLYNSKVGDPAGSCGRAVTVEGSTYILSRVIWVVHNKTDLDSDTVIDHIDGNRLNNHPSNLRAVSYRENNCNKKKSVRNKSGKSGVYIKNMKGVAFWTATWQDSNSKKHRKSFSINKYGDKEAFRLACEARDSAISMLNKDSEIYTRRHING